MTAESEVTAEGGAEATPRCGARLRTGGRCPLPPSAGKRRCFQHGGARGIGAPKGSRRNWRDGFYTRAMKAERKRINKMICQSLQALREMDGG